MPDGSCARLGSVVSWVALRPEPWHEVEPVPATTSGGLRLVPPGPLLGVVGLMFAVGPGALDWSERLIRSDWFAAMRPRPSDLVDRGPDHGVCFVPPPSPIGARVPAQADVLATRFPDVRLAAVAVLDGASTLDIEAAFCLVQAVGSPAGNNGRRLRVIVTISSIEAGRATVVTAFRQLGSTTIRGAEGMEPDHLHQFPMRAALRPPSGRLVCVDLADCLMCWPPGLIGDLHLIPFGAGPAEQALCEIVVPHTLVTATLIAHVSSEESGGCLRDLEALAASCRARLFGTCEQAPMLVTSGDRLDGMTGTADLLLIHRDDC